MSKLLALFWFALSLFGVDVGGTSIVDHVSGDGGSLSSEAYVKPNLARFHCVESSSGVCLYRLLPPDCGRHCKADPLQQFTVDVGDALVLAGLPEFQLEVAPARR